MSHPPFQPPPRRSTGGRIAALLAGSLVGVLALGLIIAGGVLLWGNGQKDDAGYVSTGSERLHTSTYAIASDDLDLDLDAPGWLVDRDRFGRIRLEATSQAAKPVFVGIAPTRDVAAYLAGTAHASVADIDSPLLGGVDVGLRAHDGTRRPTAPTEQGFWAASAHGSGTQSMTWEVRDGDWSVVVMNADGSSGVDAAVSAGADVPFLASAAWIALGSGLVLLAMAGGLLVLGLGTPPRGGPERTFGPVAAAA